MTHSFQFIRSSILSITVLLWIPFFYVLNSRGNSVENQLSTIQEYDWRVVRVFPHDTSAFTQGLIFQDGYLYESTGRRGRSEVRKVRLETGEIVLRQQLKDQYFGEGLTAWNGQLIQLTLSSGIGFVYDINTFERNHIFQINGAGWGLTNNDDEFIMSDGSSEIRFINPETFEETRRIHVVENGKLVSQLNELEMVEGKIFANKLFDNKILKIDPENGKVIGRIDLDRLVSSVQAKHSVSVLNGIAYDASTNRIFVTGKLWPNIYEIKIWPDDG